ncbi:MAG: YciI family protein [Chloroflexota bacterium]
MLVVTDTAEVDRAMKYMLLIAGAEDGWNHLSEADQAALYSRIEVWWGERKAAGELLEGAQLQPSSTATTVRRSIGGDVTVTDGPFVEGKEIVGGYGIIDVPDLDAAIRLASSWPAPDTLEIRPVASGEMG